jgi:ArsR family transcriptional regulator
VLVEAGLVEREQRGRWAWFRAVPSRIDALRDVLG